MTQLALFTPRKPRPPRPPTRWCVWLNEIGLTAAAPDVFAWWVPYRYRFEARGKVRVLASIVPGEEIEIGPYEDREDAEFIADYLMGHGAPKAFVKVRRWQPGAKSVGEGAA